MKVLAILITMEVIIHKIKSYICLPLSFNANTPEKFTCKPLIISKTLQTFLNTQRHGSIFKDSEFLNAIIFQEMKYNLKVIEG